jgi:tight adherence protein B
MFEGIEPLTLLMAGSAFVLILSVWVFGVLFWARKRLGHERKIRERLDPVHNQSVVARTLRLWHEDGVATTQVLDPSGPTLEERFRQFCTDIGWALPPKTLVLAALASLLFVAGVTYLMTLRWTPAVMACATVATLAWWYAGIRATKRQALFDRQLVDGLELCARALRAGHPLLGSFQLIADEIKPPVGRIFAEICQQHEMGIDLETSLRGIAARTRNPDMRLFSASLAINLRTGGNLANVVDGLAAVIRERMKLQRRFRVLSAQTQISKRILIAMPIIMFFVLNLLNADYMEPLYSTSRGQLMLLVATGSLVGGWWMMNKMSVIRR